MDYALFNGTSPKYEVISTSVWEQHFNNQDIFPSKHEFECPGCHIPLLLVNLNSKAPKRVYFRTFPSTDHIKGCEAENMRMDEFNKSYGTRIEEDGIILDRNLPNLVFKQQNREKAKTQNKNDDQITTTGSSKQKKLGKSVLSADEYHSRRATSFSLHRFFLEIQQSIKAEKDWKEINVSMDWPQLDKNDEKVDYITGLVYNNIKLGQIVFNTNEAKMDVEKTKKDLIFWGPAIVSEETSKYTKSGTEYYIRFQNSDIVAHWSKETLKGLVNIDLLRDAVRKGIPIDIMLCGYCYYDREDRLIFVKRTSYLSDFITIPSSTTFIK